MPIKADLKLVSRVWRYQSGSRRFKRYLAYAHSLQVSRFQGNSRDNPYSAVHHRHKYSSKPCLTVLFCFYSKDRPSYRLSFIPSWPNWFTATELANALEVSESTLSRLVHGKIDLSPVLAVKVSKVLGRSAESWMAMQANHTLARYQTELEQWTPTRKVTAEGLVAVKGGKSKTKHKAAAKTAKA